MASNKDIDVTDTTEKGAHEWFEPEEGDNIVHMCHTQNVCSEREDGSDC